MESTVLQTFSASRDVNCDRDNFHKITLAGKLCKNLDNEFDENPAKGLIADTGSEANERTDRRADIV